MGACSWLVGVLNTCLHYDSRVIRYTRPDDSVYISGILGRASAIAHRPALKIGYFCQTTPVGPTPVVLTCEIGTEVPKTPTPFCLPREEGQSQVEHPAGGAMSRDLNMEELQSSGDLHEEAPGAEHADGEGQGCPRESVQSTTAQLVK